MRDYYPCEKTIVVNIGTHPVFPHWKRIKQDLNSDLIEEVIAVSHAPSTREKLLKYTDKIGFAYVDADHSYHGLRKDIFQVLDRSGAVDPHAIGLNRACCRAGNRRAGHSPAG